MRPSKGLSAMEVEQLCDALQAIAKGLDQDSWYARRAWTTPTGNMSWMKRFYWIGHVRSPYQMSSHLTACLSMNTTSHSREWSMTLTTFLPSWTR
jgi:hypothetical protein